LTPSSPLADKAPAAPEPSAPVWKPTPMEKRSLPAVEPGKITISTLKPDSEELPKPRPVLPEQVPKPRAENDPRSEEERSLLLAAARNAAKLGKYDLALSRFEDYFRRFGEDFEVRKEYAGILVEAGRSRQALRIYQSLLARKPNDRDLRLILADVAILVKEYRLATTTLQEALAAAPGNVEIAVKLARAYVFDDEFAQALQVFDRYLTQVRPDEGRAPRLFGALLVDLERFADAIAYLQEVLRDHPNDTEIRTILVRAYAGQGDRARAMETLQSLPLADKRDRAFAQDLGDGLYLAGEYDLAQAVFNRILQVDPGSALAQLGTARVLIQQYQPAAGLKVLDGIATSDPVVARLVLLTRAEYHQIVGEYLEAKQIYLGLLHKDPADHEARLALAALYEFIREDEKAKAEYAKIPPDTTQSRKARLGAVSTLTAQRHFHEAIDLGKHLVAEWPTDGKTMAALVRTLGKASQYAEAEVLARNFLDANPRNPPALLAVRLALGRVLLDARKYEAALHEYETLLPRPGPRLPAVAYGAFQSLDHLGRKEEAHQALDSLTSLVGGDTRNRLLLSDLFAGDFDDHGTVDMAQTVLKFEPDNLAALIRVADAEERIARQTGNIRETVETAKAILARSPTNVRARLALARALDVSQDYLAAAAAYEPLLVADPDFHLAQRERAREFYSAHRFDLGAGAYTAMLFPSADERLQTDLTALTRNNPRAGPVLTPCLTAKLAGTALKDEATRVCHAAGDPEVDAALERIFLDHQARSTEQEGDRLEAQVKDTTWRPRAVIPVATKLLVLEPSNTSVLFDLGQAFGSVRETSRALEPFGEMLRIDPNEREAAVASERASEEMRPQLRLAFDFFDQNGRDGLARIDRTRYLSIVRLPYGDEDQYFDLGFGRTSLTPHDDHTLDGNSLIFGFQAKTCNDHLYIFGQGDVQQFPDRISDRVTFDTGVRYVVNDFATLRAGMFLNNVEENGESLRQDIYRYGARAGADFQIDRRWTVDGTYSYAHYSDQNDYNEGFIRSTVILCFPPNELKLILSTDIYGYSEQTIFGHPGTSDIEGTVHPYFSPTFFAYYEARLAWKQWLSRDYFYYSNQCWYSLEYGVGWDNSFNNYQVIRGLFNFDVCSWLSIGADSQVILSPVYNAFGVYGYLIARLP
jgi:tetratricopeptide (TPR) repeat protein